MSDLRQLAAEALDRCIPVSPDPAENARRVDYIVAAMKQAIEEAVEGECDARIAAEEESIRLHRAIGAAGLFVNDYGHVMRSGEGHDQ